ncbi:MAG: dephospho-CoA kinase [Salinivirgaceae bacterium]|nr:dephospho-CoA kinase [Salinivirgaceae bacterium]
MIILGITGGIGSGKSYVAQKLAQRGVPVYNADVEAKSLNNTNQQIINAYKARYGTQIYVNGQLNRKALADIIFANKAELQWVNALVHPIVNAHFAQWCKQQQSEIVAAESAILFGSQLSELCDAVVAVVASQQVRINRVMQRDASTQQQVEARMANQLSNEKMAEMADYVIVNNGEDVDSQIDELLTKLKTKN